MSETSSTSSSTNTNNVKFNDIEFLEFNYILGDNPAVSSGAPVALGNDLKTRYNDEIDYFEKNRGKRKNRKKLALPVTTRAQL